MNAVAPMAMSTPSALPKPESTTLAPTAETPPISQTGTGDTFGKGEIEFFTPQALPQSLNKPLTLGQKIMQKWRALFHPELILNPREKMLSDLLSRLDTLLSNNQVQAKSWEQLKAGHMRSTELSVGETPYTYEMQDYKERHYDWGDSYTVRTHSYNLFRNDGQVALKCDPLARSLTYRNSALNIDIQSSNRFLVKKAKTILKRYGALLERLETERRLKHEADEQNADRKLGQLPL